MQNEALLNNLSEKAAKFLTKNPTLLGQVAGVYFFEDPTHGDEAPLIALCPDGKVRRTTFYDLPDCDEAVTAYMTQLELREG